jgi:light-harvesting protein B-800-850 alpha chain
MIYGKLWLVVKPTVGIPLFLGAVAVSSFAVHYMVLSNTTWVPKFLNGSGAAKAAAVEATTPTAALAPPTTVAAASTTTKQ